MITSLIMTICCKMDLSTDPVYLDRLAKGILKPSTGAASKELQPYAKRSVAIFLTGVIFVVLYASAISPAIGLIKPVVVPRGDAIMA